METPPGKLELIVGNMFSGKSSELIRRINREKSINKNIDENIDINNIKNENDFQNSSDQVKFELKDYFIPTSEKYFTYQTKTEIEFNDNHMYYSKNIKFIFLLFK
jgi:thymidine kinase